MHVAPSWRKSSRSAGGSGNTNCLEAANVAAVVAVRDSKLPTSGDFPVLTMTRPEWAGLLTALRSGDLTR